MYQPHRIARPLIAAIALVLWNSAALVSAADVTLTPEKGKVVVKIDGKPFTEYVYTGHAKPILWPIIGPTGVEMTRNYPMKTDVDNEAHDHPHHKSMWFTHDDVNGVHFWLEYPGKNSKLRPGKIVQTKMQIDGNKLRTEDEWRDPDGKLVCSDVRQLAFGTTPGGRYIDVAVTIKATNGDVTFGDTKEGTMAVRTHPLLRLQNDEKNGNHTALGKSVNSEGVEGRAMWGKRAKWVDYWAPIDGQTVGIAIFDHPSNPRHPTWWHARHYGLVAANPFGLHDFEKKAPGAGAMTIKSGDSVTFRYRFLFHKGDVEDANIAGEYDAFAK